MDDRNEYTRAKEAELDKWESTVNLWKAKADLARAEARTEYEGLADELKTKREAARSKLEELKNTSDSAWKEIGSGLENAMNELKDSLDRASKKFS